MITDNLGLVLENQLINLYIPAFRSCLVFRVRARRNRGFEEIPYGSIPVAKDEVVYTLDGGTVAVPEDGVLPARSYTPSSKTLPSIVEGVFDSKDMFYLSPDYRNILLHCKYYITPAWIRVLTEVPAGVLHNRFQRDRVILDISKDWGWKRGFIETFHVPGVHIGFKFCNDLNANVYTFIKIVYGEYEVEIPKDPELIYGVIVGKIPAYSFTWQYITSEEIVRSTLLRVYGITGFPVIFEKDKAVKKYEELIKNLKV